jgi:hypothetical protein
MSLRERGLQPSSRSRTPLSEQKSPRVEGLRETGWAFAGEPNATPPEAHVQALEPVGATQLRDGLRGSGVGLSADRPPDPPPLLIEIRVVDRETARKNMSAGLFAGAFAAAVFALCFVAALLYIAQ